MAQLDLRPLTIGEILDRMFVLYRRHFWVFIGISAFPSLLQLAGQLARVWLQSPGANHAGVGSATAVALVSLGLFLIAYVATLFAQAATITAVNDLYLSRPITISDCLGRAWSEIGTVFGVSLLAGLAILAGLIALVIPGIFIACRLCVSVPAAIIEQRGPREAVGRSWNLTKNDAGRAFVLFLLYFVVVLAGGLLLGIPFGIATVVYRNDPGMLTTWTALSQVGNALLSIVVIPILLIAMSIFYFDLRVRKEAFDLQFMMDPTSERLTPPGTGSIPSIL